MYLTKYIYSQSLSKDSLLLINTLVGAIDILQSPLKEEFELLSPGNPIQTQISPKLQILLKERNYLLYNQEKEKELINRLLQQFSLVRPTQPRLYLCMTFNCNLNCTYCLEWNVVSSKRYDVLKPNDANIALKNILKITHELDQDSPFGMRKKPIIVRLYGGEPLLPSTTNIIDHIYQTAASQHLLLTTITNGVYIPIFLPIFKKYQQSVNSFYITIDGPKSVHDSRRFTYSRGGSFDLIISSINQLLDANFHVDVNVNLDRQSINHLPELMEIFEEQKWIGNQLFHVDLNKVNFPQCNQPPPYKYYMTELEFIQSFESLLAKYQFGNQYNTMIGEMDIYNQLRLMFERPNDFSIPRLRGCDSTLGFTWVFGPDGLIYPCVETAGFEQYAIGKFIPSFELWENQVKNWYSRNVRLIDKCLNCRFLTLCGGGCPLKSIIRGVEYSEPTCPPVEEQIKLFIDIRKNKLLRNILKADEK